MTTQLYYKIWHVLAELAKLFSILFFLNCGPKENLVDELFDMSYTSKDSFQNQEKELTIVNAQVDLIDIYMPPSRIGGSSEFINCELRKTSISIDSIMTWFNISGLYTTKLGNICLISIFLPAKIRESLNNIDIRNRVVLFQVEWDASFTSSNLSRITTMGFFINDTQSFEPVYQFREPFTTRHFVLRKSDLQSLSADTKFSIKSDIAFPLEQNNTSSYPNNTVKISNLRFILGY